MVWDKITQPETQANPFLQWDLIVHQSGTLHNWTYVQCIDAEPMEWTNAWGRQVYRIRVYNMTQQTSSYDEADLPIYWLSGGTRMWKAIHAMMENSGYSDLEDISLMLVRSGRGFDTTYKCYDVARDGWPEQWQRVEDAYGQIE